MRRDVVWAVVAVVALVAVSATLGYRLGRDRVSSAAWAARDAALAARDSAAVALADQRARTERIARTADSLALLAARKQARLETITRQADHLADRVTATADSLRQLGATTVPIGVYEEAVHALEVATTARDAAREANATLAQQVVASARLVTVSRETAAEWEARALRAEAALVGLRPPSEGRWLGLVKPPGRGVVFLAGAVVALVATR